MFKHTLIPTKGSETSAQTIHDKRHFTNLICTNITRPHITDKFPGFSNQAEMLDDTKEKSMENAVAYIQKILPALVSATRETAKHKKFGMKPAQVNTYISVK